MFSGLWVLRCRVQDVTGSRDTWRTVWYSMVTPGNPRVGVAHWLIRTWGVLYVPHGCPQKIWIGLHGVACFTPHTLVKQHEVLEDTVLVGGLCAKIGRLVQNYVRGDCHALDREYAFRSLPVLH
jgi:hypothetical protein